MDKKYCEDCPYFEQMYSYPKKEGKRRLAIGECRINPPVFVGKENGEYIFKYPIVRVDIDNCCVIRG